MESVKIVVLTAANVKIRQTSDFNVVQMVNLPNRMVLVLQLVLMEHIREMEDARNVDLTLPLAELTPLQKNLKLKHAMLASLSVHLKRNAYQNSDVAKDFMETLEPKSVLNVTNLNVSSVKEQQINVLNVKKLENLQVKMVLVKLILIQLNVKTGST